MGKMRHLIIAFVAMLVLGGIGYGAYTFLLGGGNPAHAAEGAEDKDNSVGLLGPKYQFVELQPLILPVVNQEGLSQMVTMVVALEVKDNKTAEKVRGMMPQLTDAMLSDLYGSLNYRVIGDNGVIRTEPLRKEIDRVARRMIGDENVSDVLLQVVLQRKT